LQAGAKGEQQQGHRRPDQSAHDRQNGESAQQVRKRIRAIMKSDAEQKEPGKIDCCDGQV
jgi:hypothetical protein